MAKKTRKQKQRAVTRRPGPSYAPDLPAAGGGSGTPSAAEAGQEALAVGAGAAAAGSASLGASTPGQGRRRVERVSPAAAPVQGARPRPARAQAAGYIQPLESEDAAIPFDRVPYVPADLKRVAIIAALMIALIIVADIIVSNVVK
ncbi:MAG: hypothetical protein JF887_10890 [Candidatus Dormibacteraeota bacterium]|uniref:Uncharacterized protein n=1 Tax=Candidatus Amunia macphersoniae TaxID=3127014 RepID=A0A934KRN3_9BACT|nr:hypothetical protein [Candidatus Dormibacteraeota bacterium]